MEYTAQETQKEYTISLLVENTPGVLSQVSRLFSRKGYNIESIASGTTEDPAVTRITITMRSDDAAMQQLISQIRKLLCVISAHLLEPSHSIQRELMLIKVRSANRDQREEIIQMVNVFRASIVDMSRESLTIAVVGNESKALALRELLEDFEILELVRTGAVAIERGSHTIYDYDKERGEFNYGKRVL